jgi:hypothetical protein
VTPGPTCTAPQIACGATCVNPTSDSNNCGGCGRVCAGGGECRAGACVGGTDLRDPGRACTAPTQCPGPNPVCATDANGFPGGYCTAICSNTNECGSNGICVDEDPNDSSNPLVCLRRCTGSGMGSCRTGYACTPLGDGSGVCYPQ